MLPLALATFTSCGPLFIRILTGKGFRRLVEDGGIEPRSPKLLDRSPSPVSDGFPFARCSRLPRSSSVDGGGGLVGFAFYIHLKTHTPVLSVSTIMTPFDDLVGTRRGQVLPFAPFSQPYGLSPPWWGRRLPSAYSPVYILYLLKEPSEPPGGLGGKSL